MSIDINTHRAPNTAAPGIRATPAVTPAQRERSWAQPHPEPILDAARVSLGEFRRSQRTWQAYGKFFWLRVLRPVLVLLFWVGVLGYVWRHFFAPTDELSDVGPLALYAVVVLAIILGMLLLAPVRRLLQSSEEGDATDPRDDTAPAMADYADMAPGRLSLWRRTRSLRVRHDSKGRLAQAEQTADAPPDHAPLEHPRSAA